MLEIRDVNIRAGKFTARDITLSIPDATCHVIVGPTGSGKTLLLESVIGLRKPDTGGIFLHGEDLIGLPPEKRGISYVPQDLALFPHLTVRENIRYSARFRKAGDNGRDELVSELSEVLGITHLMERSIQHLSGGEKQRVTLVRALATGTSNLVLDEPFSALHQGLRRELWYVLKELQRRYRLTILMVTHDMEEAFLLGDTITVMINGKIQQTGPGREVYTNPATRDVVDFLGIRNLFSVRLRTITEKGITAYCEELERELTLPAFACPHLIVVDGVCRIVGIRPENAVISKPGAIVQWGDNILDGTVEDVFMKGAFHTVLFRATGSNRIIEIEVADCSFKRFSPVKGRSISILLKAKDFFMLGD
jgi:ABC-type Fe3+/spermidine/putrescine transport system ATPase subunit